MWYFFAFSVLQSATKCGWVRHGSFALLITCVMCGLLGRQITYFKIVKTAHLILIISFPNYYVWFIIFHEIFVICMLTPRIWNTIRLLKSGLWSLGKRPFYFLIYSILWTKMHFSTLWRQLEQPFIRSYMFMGGIEKVHFGISIDVAFGLYYLFELAFKFCSLLAKLMIGFWSHGDLNVRLEIPYLYDIKWKNLQKSKHFFQALEGRKIVKFSWRQFWINNFILPNVQIIAVKISLNILQKLQTTYFFKTFLYLIR